MPGGTPRALLLPDPTHRQVPVHVGLALVSETAASVRLAIGRRPGPELAHLVRTVRPLIASTAWRRSSGMGSAAVMMWSPAWISIVR